MKKQDNKGFTLIELLVAVMVLAIVIVPLLHSFVSSFRVNAKSRQMMRATTLAQKEMEIFEKEKIEDLMAMTEAGDPTQFVYAVTPPAEGGDGRYTFKREDVLNDDGDTAKFDVVVTLDPERNVSGDRYYDVNTKSLMQMNTISNVDSGSFVQSIRSPGNAVDYDTTVYGIFNNLKEAGGAAAGYDIDRFEKELKRKITIEVKQEEEASKTITKAKVTYEYTLEAYFGVMPAEYKTYTEEKIVFDNSQELDASGNPIDLKSVYLFYAPRYESDNEDEIVIINEAKLPIDFYIVRQDIWGKGTTVVQKPGTAYEAKVSIVDGLNGENTYGRYWTNLNLEDTANAEQGAPMDLSLKNYDTNSEVIAGRADLIKKTNMKKLGQAEAEDRIYTMEVKIYKADANPATEAPLVTMTGSKIE